MSNLICNILRKLAIFQLMLLALLIQSADAEVEKNIPFPDLEWQPEPFRFKKGKSVKYIDYESGNDLAPGSKEKPWKHHPWDKEARAKAASCKGVHTYCFKKGVIYRGALIAKESGEDGNPIRLTVDPSWGNGKASIYGSFRIQGGWMPCNDTECEEIPPEGRNKIWYVDTNNSVIPRMLWEIKDGRTIRIPIARTPNWKIVNPDDPRSEWWELTGCILEVKCYLNDTKGFVVGDRITEAKKSFAVNDAKNIRDDSGNRVISVTKDYITIECLGWKNESIRKDALITNGRIRAKVTKVSGTHEVMSRLVDNVHFNQNVPEYWVGATMWAEKDYMPKPDAEKVIGYNPTEHSLRINYHRGVIGPGKFCRYYLENLPVFLDSAGEYYYENKAKHSGRLYIHLPEDRNPNLSNIELAKETVILDINNKSNITLSGLDIRFSNNIDCGSPMARHAPLYASAIRIKGNCKNIKICNSEISHVPCGIVASPEKERVVIDNIMISDNFLHDIDSTSVGLSNGRSIYGLSDLGSRLTHVNIHRNKIINTGYRCLNFWGIGLHAIHVEGGELVEISENIVRGSWGAGILSFNGSSYENGHIDRPLMRILIHNNKVTDCLLGLQDYGGIASWMGGPSYIYNNIIGNPVGYKHSHYKAQKRSNWYRTSCFGVGIYLDGQYKGYAFNNIIRGKNNNVNDRIYSSCAFNEAMGFMNTVFNNTMYNFGVGIHKGMIQHNRCYYIGNLMLNMGHKFIQQEPVQKYIEYNSLAYAHNVFKGNPSCFGQLGQKKYDDLAEWRDGISSRKCLVSKTGIQVYQDQLQNASDHDFRLKSNSAAIDNGAKVFVPWGLYAVVGEWNFIKNSEDPSIVLGENMNWNNEWVKRNMFQDIPRNNLSCHYIDKSSYEMGFLESWTDGALKFNGKTQFCDLPDSCLKKDFEWTSINCRKKPCTGSYEGEKRTTVDMGINNFLIEVVLKAEKESCEGGIVCKYLDRGYIMDLDENGFPRIRLKFGRSECSRVGATKINDNAWHHVIAEIDRTHSEGINIYIDGKLSNGEWEGFMDQEIPLYNTADFTIGKTLGASELYYKGLIDFLRISRGTLKDAETSIDELYQWEFDGPFLKDFFGRTVNGKARDVGALEYEL